MKKIILIIGFSFFVFGILAFSNYMTTPIYLEVPKNWPKPVYDFKNNPLSKEGFELGRQLFYDPILSKDKTISCASCHLQATGFTHVDHDLSHGIEGKIGIRNSLTLQNLAWSKNFMWDGGINHLDVQALAPMPLKSVRKGVGEVGGFIKAAIATKECIGAVSRLESQHMMIGVHHLVASQVRRAGPPQQPADERRHRRACGVCHALPAALHRRDHPRRCLVRAARNSLCTGRLDTPWKLGRLHRQEGGRESGRNRWICPGP